MLKIKDNLELKDGMYVRTKLTDFCNLIAIRRIIEIDEDANEIWLDDDVIDDYGEIYNTVREEDIDKTGSNLIDLIEENDLLEIRYLIKSNEYQKEVVQVIKNNDNKLYVNAFPQKIFIKDFDTYGVEILSVLTKEQFESQKYIVESE